MSPVLHRRAAGMSLVELMVAMLIGLIGIVIITHLYVTNDQYKRSTTGIGAAQINGAVALYNLERDLRMTGYGVTHMAALTCRCNQPLCSPLQYHYEAKSSFPPAGSAFGALPGRVPVPVVIADTPGGPDQITVLYSNANERVLPAALKEPAMVSPYNYKPEGPWGFRVGDLIVVSNPDNNTCVLKQITKVTEDGYLEHTSGPFNPGGSWGPPMPQGAALFNLGNWDPVNNRFGPAWRTYFVGANKLRSEDVLRQLAGEANATQALVDDIVDLQAEYGRDDGTVVGTKAEDGIVDSWGTLLPVDPLDPNKVFWHQIIAIRVAVLARSQNYEKPGTPGGACEATTVANAPKWAGGGFTVPGGLPSCYKYRVFETVIPLRNMIWRSS